MSIGKVDMYNYNIVSKKGSTVVNNMSTEEKIERYFKKLQNDYSGFNFKKNNYNIHSESGITITLSPDLIKKAVNNKKVDKDIRKTLDDLYKSKGKLKLYNCTKDGNEITGVSFFIDGSQRASCSIKLKKNVSLAIKTKEKRKVISSNIEKQKFILEKYKGFESSLFYKYINLLSKNKFAAIDFTV